jgi:16S rRNA processing protein RimM
MSPAKSNRDSRSSSGSRSSSSQRSSSGSRTSKDRRIAREKRRPKAPKPPVLQTREIRQPNVIEPSSPTRVGIASVRRSWGKDGSIAITPFSEGEDRFSPGDTVFVAGGHPAKVIDSHRAGTATVLQLDVIRNTRDADALRGTIIEMEGEDLPEAPEGAYYHYEIVGINVKTTEGEDLGVVLEIIVTGANDVYVVGAPGAIESKDQILIPAISDVVIDVDTNNGVVTVNLPEGLR